MYSSDTGDDGIIFQCFIPSIHTTLGAKHSVEDSVPINKNRKDKKKEYLMSKLPFHHAQLLR